MAEATIILTRAEISSQIDIAKAIPAIEQAMGEFEKGNDYLPSKAVFDIPIPTEGATIAACVTGYTTASDILSMKLGQERTDNPQLGLPTTNSWIAAFRPNTGELLMICDGTLPTMYRTASAAAVAANHLARADAATLAVIGAGQLGRHCLLAVSTVRNFEKIFVFDVRNEATRQVIDDLSTRVGVPMEVSDARTACRGAEVIVTATNSREPIIKADWIRPGSHLSCMGADLHDKIECEMALLPGCRLFADFIEHTLQRGEVSQAVEQGVLSKDCYAGSLGQVINGDVAGRESDDQITLYDGVGIGIQDTTIAATIYEQARAANLGTRISFS